MPAHLFVASEGEIPSTEGATQGYPLTMAIYVLPVGIPTQWCLMSLRFGLQTVQLLLEHFQNCSHDGSIFLQLGQIMVMLQMY